MPERPVTEGPVTEGPAQRATELAARLQVEGHHVAAERVQVASGAPIGGGLSHALMEACEFVLTAIEALDPKTALMAEELRLEVEKKLR